MPPIGYFFIEIKELAIVYYLFNFLRMSFRAFICGEFNLVHLDESSVFLSSGSFKALHKEGLSHHIILKVILGMVITISINNLRALKRKMAFHPTVHTSMIREILVILKFCQISYPFELLMILGELW